MAYIVLLFFAFSTMNVINRYYYFAYIAIALFCVKSDRKFKLDSAPVAMLTVLAVSWVAFSPESAASILGLIKPFTYVLCYIVGNNLLDDDVANSNEKTSFRLFYIAITAVAAGSLIHYLLNWYINAEAVDRNTVDIWTGTAAAATLQAGLACLPLGLSIAFLFSKTKIWVKILSVAAVVVSLLYNLVLAGRTLFILLFAVIAVAFLHRLSMQKKGRLRVIVVLLAIILLVVFVYQTNLFNVREFIEDSPIYERFFAKNSSSDLDEDGRMRKKLYHLDNMDKAIFGGAHNREEIGHSHDIILDTYDEAGIFALIAILGYLGISLIHLVRCVRDKSLPFTFRNVVLCVYTVVYLEFMVEPILQGMPWFFATFCLIDGYVSRILSHNSMIKSKVR